MTIDTQSEPDMLETVLEKPTHYYCLYLPIGCEGLLGDGNKMLRGTYDEVRRRHQLHARGVHNLGGVAANASIFQPTMYASLPWPP